MILSALSHSRSLRNLAITFAIVLGLGLDSLTLPLHAQTDPTYVCPPGQFLHAWETNIAGVCAAAPSGGAPYPGTAGIANFNGTAWGTSFGVSGTGTTVALTAGPTITGATLPSASLTSPAISSATLSGTTGFTALSGGAGSTVTAASYLGQFGGQYGTFVLGSGYGAQIEKTVSDSTPVIVASINGATTGTGDYYAVKDATGMIHTLLDNALGLHATTINGAALTTSTNKVLLGLPTLPNTLALDGNGNVAIGLASPLPTNLPYAFGVGPNSEFHTDAAGNVRGVTFNGIGLATGGPTTEYLSHAGTYLPLPTVNSGFPITLGTTSIAAGSTNTALAGMTNIVLSGQTATPDQNFNSGSLAFTGSFDDAGPIPQTWAMLNIMGSGLTPTSTLSISPIPGGTTGSRIFQVSADEEILENGAGIVHVTGNSAYMGVSATGVTVGPSDVTITGTAASGNVYLSPGATGSVIASRPVRLPVASFVNGGSTINLAAPAGGSGTFNQNVTAKNGDLNPCPTGTPTYTLGAGAGGGATASISGTNCAGVITITTGGAPASQSYFITVNFANPFTPYGYCTFNPLSVTLQDANYNVGSVYISTGNASNFSIGSIGTMTLAPLSNHQWSYTCGG